MSTFGKALLESAHKALAAARGEMKPVASIASRMARIDAAAIPERLSLSLDKLAATFGFAASASEIGSTAFENQIGSPWRCCASLRMRWKRIGRR